MTAEEMFEKLGYTKYTKDITGDRLYRDIVYRNQNFFVEFSAIKQTVVAKRMTINWGNAVNYQAIEVDVALFQAIQKQLEELGWLKRLLQHSDKIK